MGSVKLYRTDLFHWWERSLGWSTFRAEEESWKYVLISIIKVSWIFFQNVVAPIYFLNIGYQSKFIPPQVVLSPPEDCLKAGLYVAHVEQWGASNWRNVNNWEIRHGTHNRSSVRQWKIRWCVSCYCALAIGEGGIKTIDRCWHLRDNFTRDFFLLWSCSSNISPYGQKIVLQAIANSSTNLPFHTPKTPQNHDSAMF